MKLTKTFALVTLLVSLVGSGVEAKTNDGKITGSDFTLFVDEAIQLPSVIGSLGEIKNELSSATSEDRKQLLDFISEKLQVVVTDDQLDFVIEKAFIFLNGGFDLFEAVKGLMRNEPDKKPVVLKSNEILKSVKSPFKPAIVVSDTKKTTNRKQ